MERETLSVYGSILLILIAMSMLLALASPLGKYLSDSVKEPIKSQVDYVAEQKRDGVDLNDIIVTENHIGGIE